MRYYCAHFDNQEKALVETYERFEGIKYRTESFVMQIFYYSYVCIQESIEANNSALIHLLL
jgi:hypothetical protein